RPARLQPELARSAWPPPRPPPPIHALASLRSSPVRRRIDGPAASSVDTAVLAGLDRAPGADLTLALRQPALSRSAPQSPRRVVVADRLSGRAAVPADRRPRSRAAAAPPWPARRSRGRTRGTGSTAAVPAAVRRRLSGPGQPPASTGARSPRE